MAVNPGKEPPWTYRLQESHSSVLTPESAISYGDDTKAYEVKMETTPNKPGIYLVRHGKTKLNDDNRSIDKIRGWIDVPLDEEGEEEAKVVARYIQKLNPTKIYTSDMKRAFATANESAKLLGMKPIISKSFRPWNLGDLQGKPSKDAVPYIVEHTIPKNWNKAIPGGESFRDFTNRYLSALKDIMDEHERTGDLIVIVSHYRNLKTAEGWLVTQCHSFDSVVFMQDDLSTGAILRISREGDGWKFDRVYVPGEHDIEEHLPKEKGIENEDQSLVSGHSVESLRDARGMEQHAADRHGNVYEKPGAHLMQSTTPFRKSFQVVRYINAESFRNQSLDQQEFGAWATHRDYPSIIPDNEIWIDENADPADIEYYIADAEAIEVGINQGMDEAEANDYGIAVEHSERERTGVWPQHDQIPEDVYIGHYKDVEYEGELLHAWIVDGTKVRDMYKTDFTQGGNSYIYPWMPEDEVWIEKSVAETERDLIVLHESTERYKMKHEQVGYNDAHEQASNVEFEARQKSIYQDIDKAVSQTNTNPTEEQKETGKYKKGKFSFHGIPIDLENPRGSIRSGEGPDGPWSVRMAHHYGYIRNTESGADEDPIDVFIGPYLDSEKVFVVNQINKDGLFDEHKVMLGFDSIADAAKGYLDSYSPGWQGLGSIAQISLQDFKRWVKEGNSAKPLAVPNTKRLGRPHIGPKTNFPRPYPDVYPDKNLEFPVESTPEERAKTVDLITLPENIKSTSCSNCMWVYPPGKDEAYCYHKSVDQPLKGATKACCAVWNQLGTQRTWPDQEPLDIPRKDTPEERFKAVDLVMFPEGVDGTNCGNCIWFKENYCYHNSVDQPVTDRMTCALWETLGTKRPGEEEQKEKSLPAKYKAESYFAVCPRDDEGRCLPSGQAEETKTPREHAQQQSRENIEEKAKEHEKKSVSERKQRLLSSRVAKTDILNGGANQSRIFTFEDGSKAIYKPKKGESERLRKEYGGFLYIREAAVSDIADVLGLNHLVPNTVIREDLEEGIGSVQEFVESARSPSRLGPGIRFGDNKEDLINAGLFDFLIANGDRRLDNWLVQEKIIGEEFSDKLELIDNGASLPSDKEEPSSLILKEAAKAKAKNVIPEEVKDWKWEEIESILHKYEIEEKAISLTKERFDFIQGNIGKPIKNLLNWGKKTEEKQKEKALSVFNEGTGGALVPPPKFGKRDQSLLMDPEGIKKLRLRYKKFTPSGPTSDPSSYPVLHPDEIKPSVKGSYFEECPRDEEGRCLPSGRAEKPTKERLSKKPKPPKVESRRVPSTAEYKPTEEKPTEEKPTEERVEKPEEGQEIAEHKEEAEKKEKPKSEEKQKLSSDKVKSSNNLGGGANESRVITFEDGSKAVYKPKNGENEELRETVEGELYKRETAASGLADLLGLSHLVPNTVTRKDLENGIGSVQEFVPNAKIAALLSERVMYGDSDENLRQAAIFDFLIGNIDRHEGNWMVQQTISGGEVSNDLKLIDNGFSFTSGYRFPNIGRFIKEAVGRNLTVPEAAKDWKWEEVESVLLENEMEEDAIELTRKRFNSIKENAGREIRELEWPTQQKPEKLKDLARRI